MSTTSRRPRFRERRGLWSTLETAGTLVLGQRRGTTLQMGRIGECDRLNDQARKVLALAEEEARCLGNSHLTTGHLLLGLVRDDRAIAGQVLRHRFGLNPADSWVIVESMHVEVGYYSPGALPLSPRLRHVLDLALDEARRLGHDWVRSEHLLLGLLREGEGFGCEVLRRQAGELEGIRAELVRSMMRAAAA